MRFMDMTPDELRASYWETRQQIASWDAMASPGHGRQARGRIARGVLRNVDRLDLIVNVARKRGIPLTTPEASAP